MNRTGQSVSVSLCVSVAENLHFFCPSSFLSAARGHESLKETGLALAPPLLQRNSAPP